MLGFVLGLLQMLLYAMYRNRKQVIDDQEKKLPAPEHVKNIVILSTIATSEVHPVDAKPDDDVDVKDGKDPDGDEHDKCVVVVVDASGELQLKSDDEPCAVWMCDAQPPSVAVTTCRTWFLTRAFQAKSTPSGFNYLSALLAFVVQLYCYKSGKKKKTIAAIVSLVYSFNLELLYAFVSFSFHVK